MHLPFWTPACSQERFSFLFTSWCFKKRRWLALPRTPRGNPVRHLWRRHPACTRLPRVQGQTGEKKPNKGEHVGKWKGLCPLFGIFVGYLFFLCSFVKRLHGSRLSTTLMLISAYLQSSTELSEHGLLMPKQTPPTHQQHSKENRNKKTPAAAPYYKPFILKIEQKKQVKPSSKGKRLFRLFSSSERRKTVQATMKLAESTWHHQKKLKSSHWTQTA